MNTEDDTYRKLKRVSFAELTTLIDEDFNQCFDIVIMHNWTWEEYCVEWERIYMNNIIRYI
jgi:hypothetical protein